MHPHAVPPIYRPRRAWTTARAITDVLRVVADRPEGAPGIILALQSFNQDLTHNSHIHALATEGLVCSNDTFLPVSTIDALLLEHAFRRRVFNLLIRHHKITPELVEAIHSWKHSGFSVHTAVRVLPEEPKTAERVIHYLLRPPITNSRTRTRHATQIEIICTDTVHDSPQVITLDPLDFLARATSHIPQPRQHQLRYYGAYSPRARSARQKRLTADSHPTPTHPPHDDSPAARARRLSWAKLLRRVLEVEPLACPTCPGKLRIVSFITDHAVVDHIIAHLRRTRPGLFPPARGSPTPTPTHASVCRADADGFIYAQDLPPDE